MKYTLVSINNTESVGNQLVGTKNEFSFDGRIFYFGTLYNSTVKSIVIDESIMIVNTKNSKYTFEKDKQ